MDWKSLILSDEFRAYRKKQAEKVATIIERDVYESMSGETAHYHRMNGEMDMAKELIKLPHELTSDEELLAILDRQLAEDMAHITQYLVRKRFNVEH